MSRWFSVAAALVLAGGNFSCTSIRPPQALARFEFNEPHMGVPFRIVLYAPDGDTATNAATAAFRRIKELNDRLTDYDLGSELSQLSRTSGQGRALAVSPDLWFLLDRAQRLAVQTSGAFDITVGPMVNLWRKARREQVLPTPERLSLARQAVGYEKIRLKPRGHLVELLHPDMRLDLGAIAKGYAADQALAVVRRHRIDRALVAAAGDIAAGAAPPGKEGWRVEVAPIDYTNAPSSRFVLLKNAGLSTSGDVFQRLEINGTRYSHIVDPRTGIGLTNSALVTVIAPDGTTADSLATAVSVLGIEKGLRLIQQTRNVAAYIVYPTNEQIQAVQTRGFSRWAEK